MTQTRLGSLYETMFNIAIGFAVNFIANIWLIPAFVSGQDGNPVTISLVQNWWMGCAFTVISVIRMYVLRRWFNARLHAAALRLAGEST